jgi:hypothetical protein
VRPLPKGYSRPCLVRMTQSASRRSDEADGKAAWPMRLPVAVEAGIGRLACANGTRVRRVARHARHSSINPLLVAQLRRRPPQGE